MLPFAVKANTACRHNLTGSVGGRPLGGGRTGSASANRLSGVFLPHDSRARDHGTHFSEGDGARQILETAVRCDDNSFGRHIRQCAADASGDGLRRFDAHVR